MAIGISGPAEPLAASLATVDSVLPGRRGRSFVILHVEDNLSNIALMDDLLSDVEGVVLLTAHTGELGLELARTRRPDLVIMDINLPGMSGFAATQALAASEQTRDIPVVALSAVPLTQNTERVRRAGFYRYLTKPVNLDELTAVIEKLMADARS